MCLAQFNIRYKLGMSIVHVPYSFEFTLFQIHEGKIVLNANEH